MMPPPAALAALQERLARRLWSDHTEEPGDDWKFCSEPCKATFRGYAASALTFFRETIQAELTATGTDLTLTRAQEAPRGASMTDSVTPAPVQHLRPQVEDETEILQRLAEGDTIVFSQDGDMAWFTKGDRAFVGDAIMSLREKGFLLRRCDDEENYRGLSEYDTISEAGRAALSARSEGSDNG